MKKILSIAIVLAALLSVLPASSISSPAATVNLIRNTAITEQQLNQKVKEYEALGVTAKPSEVLQTMIDDEVFLQGAERDGVTLNSRQVDALYNQVYQNAVQQAAAAGQTITQADFDAEVIAQFGSIAAYKDSIRKQQILNNYVMQEKGEELKNVTGPTEAEIASFYRQNQQQFFQPECVKIAHIYIPKTVASDTVTQADADKANADAKAKLEKVSEDIKSGKITFERAVVEYSQDPSSNTRGGDIGWLTANNTTARQGWGEDFCEALLALSDGEISGVLESNTGYHIVRASVHYDAKLLKLTDNVSPEDNITVHDYIYNGLYQQKVQEKMAQEVQKMVADLRSQARIRVLYRGN